MPERQMALTTSGLFALSDLYKTCGTRVVLDAAILPPNYGYNYIG